MANKWTDEEDKFLKENWNNFSARQILEKGFLERHTILSIQSRATILGVKKKNRNYSRKYKRNENIFDNINPISSYLAGFIAADGHITKEKNRIQINLANKDKELLEKIKDIFEYDGPILPHKNNQSSLRINSYKLIEDLEKKFNIARERKINHTSIPPNLNEINSLCFIIGLIDGDGCTSIIKNKYIEISIVADENIINWISNFTKKYSLSNGKNITKQGILYKFKLIRVKAENFIKKCLEIKELEDIRLYRKWNKAIDWIKYKNV